jgi:TetR/AcrR family transcriptional regulator, transcriptional repressor of aconitase
MQNKKANTRQQIINAGQECLSQYGYAKTTFVDIAKRAGMSRALLYLYFKNKKDLFSIMNEERANKYFSQSQEVLKSDLTKKEKLEKIVDIWLIDPYRIIVKAPNPDAWLDELKNIPRGERHFRDLFIKSLTPLSGRDLAEVVVLAYRGLLADRPSVKLFEKRSQILIDLADRYEKTGNIG